MRNKILAVAALAMIVEPASAQTISSVNSSSFGSGLSVGQGAYAGFFKDDQPATVLTRVRDRLFIGEGAPHTGNRTGALGGTYLTEYGANYFEKNAQVTILGTQGRYGLVVGAISSSDTPPSGGATGSSIALAGIGIARSGTGSARGGYFECFLQSATGFCAGVEIALGNYTNVMPTPTAYGNVASGIAGAIYITAEAGHGYTTGDANTPVPAATMPVSHALEVAGGSTGAIWQKFVGGIVFRDGALYRGVDGLTGTATAIRMAQQHQIIWDASAALKGAVLRSDVTPVANQDVGLVFANNQVSINASAELPIMRFVADTATPVNYIEARSARTANAVRFTAKGTDTSVSIDFMSQSAGVIRMLAYGTGTPVEILRASGTASNANNGVLVAAAFNAAPTIRAYSAANTNADFNIAGQGTGKVTTPGTFEALLLSGATATSLVTSRVAMNDGAGAGAGTLTNAPAAGNPTKWIPIDDNGTTRYIPAW